MEKKKQQNRKLIMNSNEDPYGREFWGVCDISFPTQKGFLDLFLFCNRHLLCTTLYVDG